MKNPVSDNIIINNNEDDNEEEEKKEDDMGSDRARHAPSISDSHMHIHLHTQVPHTQPHRRRPHLAVEFALKDRESC